MYYHAPCSCIASSSRRLRMLDTSAAAQASDFDLTPRGEFWTGGMSWVWGRLGLGGQGSDSLPPPSAAEGGQGVASQQQVILSSYLSCQYVGLLSSLQLFYLCMECM